MALPFDFDGTFVNSGDPLDAGELRRADSALVVQAGVTSGLTVSVDGSDVVTVLPGSAVISGEDAAVGTGMYRGGLAAAQTGNLAARNATNGRIDLVVLRQLDTDVVGSHAAKKMRLEVIAGTPSATPAVPTRPSMAVELGRVTVPASGGGAATVDSSWRTYACAVGGVLRVPTAARLPASAQLRQRAVALDTGYQHLWNGGAWVALDTDWTTVSSSVTGAWGIRWRRRGYTVSVIVDGGISVPNNTTTSLGSGMLPAAVCPPTQARFGGYFAGFPGTITVAPDGSFSAIHQSGATRASVSGSSSWTVD